MRRTLLLALLAILAPALVVAQAKDEKAPPKNGTAKAAGDLKKGKQLYEDVCGICHFSTNREKKVGPGLKGIFKRGKFADGKKVDDTSMREWILKGGKDMPSFEDALSKQQIDDLLAFLKTI